MIRRALLLLLLAAPAHAAVSISAVSGTFGQGQTVTVTASGQGSKTNAAPHLWADFGSNVNPSSLGRNTTWNQTQNMTYTSNGGFNGTGGIVGTAGNGFWTMRTDSSSPYWGDNGQTSYIFRRTKKNFAITDTSQNYKTWRCYKTPDTGGNPNIYFAANNGRLYIEYMLVESGYWGNFNTGAANNWFAEEILMKGSSGAGNKDGTLTYRVDGVQKSNGTILTRTASIASDLRSNYVFHEVVANTSLWTPSWSSSNQVWGDEIYVDTTWQRVMIGDASTFSACRKFGFIIPSAWSTSSITGTVSATAFSDGQTAYLYVFDATNTPNATGYAITINGTVAGANPPDLTGISHSTGPYTGGTGQTATGTDFSTTVTVYVGTTSANNVTRHSATKVTFTVPPGPPGGVEDVTLFNDDGQFDVITDTFTYSSLPPAVNTADADPRVSEGKIFIGAFR